MTTFAETLGAKRECAICLDQYREPKVLSCLHSYCKECLEKLIKRVGEKYTITCPQCRYQTEVAEGNVGVLHSNPVNNNVLESVSSWNKKIGDESYELCENCDNGDKAVKRCKVCCMFMCEFCTEAHRRTRTTKYHLITSFEKMNTAGTATFTTPTTCSKHKAEMLDFLCQSPSCKRPVCRECVLSDHQGHKYDLIYNVAGKEKDILRKLIEELNAKAKHFEAAIKVLERTEEEIMETVQNVKTEIDCYIDEIIQMLEEKRCSLKEDVNSITATKTKLLQREKDDIALLLASMQSSIDFTEHALDRSEYAEIVSLKKNITQQLAELKSKKVPKIQTKTLDVVFETTCSKIKELIVNIAHVSERSNYKQIISPNSQNCSSIFQKQNSQPLEPAVNKEFDSYFYDDYPFDYYKLVPLEVDGVDFTCQDVFDSSSCFKLRTAQEYSQEIDVSFSDAKSLPCDAKEVESNQTSPRSPTQHTFEHSERTCASMCEVYRLPTNCYSDELNVTPKKREFVLQAKTKDGLLQKACGDKVCITIKKPNGRRENLDVVDNSDGSYSFEFIPQTCGSYLFHITVNGNSVKKEGFSWEVRNCSKIISDRGL